MWLLAGNYSKTVKSKLVEKAHNYHKGQTSPETLETFGFVSFFLPLFIIGRSRTHVKPNCSPKVR